MRTGRLLNGPITALIGDLGHSDKIMIVDAGWPIPSALRYDICLTHGQPRLTDVLAVVADELKIEKVIVDSEMRTHGPEVHDGVRSIIEAAGRAHGEQIKIEYELHDVFKAHAGSVKGIIRTGECTPYCNLVLVAGLAFAPNARLAP
jgi:D-ribose pyranase